MEAILLCSAGAADRPATLSVGGSEDLVLLAVSGDGFSCYEATTLEKRASYALGSAAASFAAPVQRGSGGAFVAAVQPGGGGPPSLVLLQPAGGRGAGADPKLARSILDSQPQIKLPSALHSVHALGAGGGPAGAVAVVLADGTVAGADFEHQKLRPLPAAAAVVTASAGRGHPGRPAAAAAAAGCLAVSWQPAGAGGSTAVAFYRASRAHPFLEPLCSCELPAPAPGARLLGLHLQPAGVAAQWSGGVVSTHAIDYRAGGGTRPAAPGAAFSAAPLGSFLGVDLAAGDDAAAAGAAAAQQQDAAGRKRKAGAAAGGGGGGGAPRLLVAPLGGAQLLLAAVAPAAAGGGAALRHAVVDGRYGCVLSAGACALPLDAGGAAAAADAPPPQLAPLAGGGGRVALLAGGRVFVAAVASPRADLAGLLGCLSVAGGGGPGPGGAPVVQLPRVGGGGGAGAAAASEAPAAGVRVTAVVQRLDVGALLGGIKHAAAETGGGGAAAGGALALLPATEADGVPAAVGADAGEGGGLVVAAQQLSSALDKWQAARGGRGGGAGAPDAKALEMAARALAAQLQAAAAAAGHPERQQRQRRLRSSLAAQQLLGRAADALAEAGLWDALGDLLAAQPLQSLGHAPRLLPLAAAAGRHELVAQVCRAAEDVPADALHGALLQLLGGGGGGDGGAAGAAEAARHEHRQRLAAAAAAVVDAAAAAPPGAPAAAWLASARAAAAAVDGFSAREACLHPLVAADADAVEVQAALQRLPARHVLRLLRYLTKWVTKYGDQPLEEAGAEAAAAAAAAAAGGGDDGGGGCRGTRGAACGGGGPPRSPGVPAELRAPGWGQVLEWSRALLDAHLTKLATLPAAAAPLRALAACVSGHADAAARLAPLRGVAEHMLAGGALPTAAAAAATTYTVELLDLRVRTK